MPDFAVLSTWQIVIGAHQVIAKRHKVTSHTKPGEPFEALPFFVLWGGFRAEEAVFLV